MAENDRVSNWAKALAAVNATNAYPTTAPTVTAPVLGTNGVVDPLILPGYSWRRLQILPFGGNDDNDQILVRAVAWNRSASGLWVPRILAEVTAVLSSAIPGVAGQDVIDTQFFADDLTLTAGGIAALYEGSADTAAWFEVDVSGSNFVSVQAKTGVGGDGANALYRFTG